VARSAVVDGCLPWWFSIPNVTCHVFHCQRHCTLGFNAAGSEFHILFIQDHRSRLSEITKYPSIQVVERWYTFWILQMLFLYKCKFCL